MTFGGPFCVWGVAEGLSVKNAVNQEFSYFVSITNSICLVKF